LVSEDFFGRVGVEELRRKDPLVIERRLKPSAALRGASAEPADPLGRVAQMVAHLFFRFRSERRELREGAPLKSGTELEAVSGEEKLTQDSVGKVAPWLLEEERIPVLDRLAEVGEVVLGAATPLDPTR